MRDGTILRNGASTGQDYWTLAGGGRSRRQGDRRRPRKPVAALHDHRREQRAARPAGQDFRQACLHPRHAACRHGACARRAPAQPRRHHRHDRRSRDRARRQGHDRLRAQRQFPRHRRRRRNRGRSRRRPPRSMHVTWQNVETPSALQQEANWLLQRPAIDRLFGAPEPADAARPASVSRRPIPRLSRACLDLAVLRARRYTATAS